MSGMVLLGSTGEAVMLSDEESRQALRVARDCNGAGKVLLAGVGRESVFETLRQADYAAALDYDAVLVRTPHYYRKQLRNREMLTYYQAVADRSPLPVLLYSVPGCTAYDLPIEVVAELVDASEYCGDEGLQRQCGPDRGAGPRHAFRSESEGSGDHCVLRSHCADVRLPKRLRATALLWLLSQLVSGATAVAVSRPGRRSRRGPGKWDFKYLRLCPNAIPFAGSGSHRRCAGPGNLCPASLPGGLHRVEGERRGAGSGQAAAHCAGGHRGLRQDGDPGVKYALDLNGYYGGRPECPCCPWSRMSSGWSKN